MNYTYRIIQISLLSRTPAICRPLHYHYTADPEELSYNQAPKIRGKLLIQFSERMFFNKLEF